MFQEHPLIWIKKSLWAASHPPPPLSYCCCFQGLELQWLRDQKRGREPVKCHRGELLTPFLMRFSFLSFSLLEPPNFEFSCTTTLRELESSELREPSSGHLCPRCPYQVLSRLCMNNTVSVCTCFKKTPGADPAGQVPLTSYLFSWGADEQGCKFSRHQFRLLCLIKSGWRKKGI